MIQEPLRELDAILHVLLGQLFDAKPKRLVRLPLEEEAEDSPNACVAKLQLNDGISDVAFRIFGEIFYLGDVFRRDVSLGS